MKNKVIPEEITPEIEFAYKLVIKDLLNNGRPYALDMMEMEKITEESFENQYTTLLKHTIAIKKILNTAIKQMKGTKNGKCRKQISINTKRM